MKKKEIEKMLKKMDRADGLYEKADEIYAEIRGEIVSILTEAHSE